MTPRLTEPSGPPADAPIFSVRQLNREAKRLLEGAFPAIWVSGEISRFTHHSSGHMYFDLKDADAAISCAMFKGSQRSLRFKPGGGQQVVLKGKVSLFEAGGRYQIIVEHMEEAGEGLLRQQFEALKSRLQAEGLFDEAAKQSLPALPSYIGVVTSSTGAAIRDILHTLHRRFPIAEIIVYPTRVQGEGAREEIAAAIDTANRRGECDVLIVARGGGSLEDLWAFNEEVVARAIARSTLPIVAGIGHEIDVTIADLVADVRAPTPTGAAELIAPDRAALKHALASGERRAALSIQRMQQILQSDLNQLLARLRRTHPQSLLRDLQQRLDELTLSLGRRMNRRLQTAQQRFAGLAGTLHAVSPLATLDRGYAIVRKSGSTSVLRRADELKTGDTIEAQLASGLIDATVTGTRKTGEDQ